MGTGRLGGDVQAPAMMIRRIHFSGDMLARVDWTLVVKRWPIVEARLASSSIVVVGGGGVGRWCARVVRGGEGSGVIKGVRWWEQVGRRRCRKEDGSEPPWRVRNQNARKSCDAMRSGLPAVADGCAGTDPTRCRRAWLALEGVR